MIRSSRRALLGASCMAIVAIVSYASMAARLEQRHAVLCASVEELTLEIDPAPVRGLFDAMRADVLDVPVESGKGADATQLLSRIATWMDESAIKDRSLVLGASRSESGFVLTQMELTFTCSPESFYAFLRRLESVHKHVRVARARVRAIPDADPTLVTVYVRADAITRDAEGGV